MKHCENEAKGIDEESQKGRFGWCAFEENYIPYIFRNKGQKFTLVKILEQKLLNQLLSVLPLHFVKICFCICSYYITESECRVFNEINLEHSDCHFGKNPFTSNDLVVDLGEAKELYHFLRFCYKKLIKKKSNSNDRCGLLRFNTHFLVPYTVMKGKKFVPLFYFKDKISHLKHKIETAKVKTETVNGWDLVIFMFFIIHVYVNIAPFWNHM